MMLPNQTYMWMPPQASVALAAQPPAGHAMVRTVVRTRPPANQVSANDTGGAAGPDRRPAGRTRPGRTCRDATRPTDEAEAVRRAVQTGTAPRAACSAWRTGARAGLPDVVGESRPGYLMAPLSRPCTT